MNLIDCIQIRIYPHINRNTARPSDGLKARCEELGIPVEVIGDAAGARDCTIATREGYDAGMAI